MESIHVEHLEQNSESSFNTVDRFGDFKQNNASRNQFYRRLPDINQNSVPMASHRRQNKTTLNKMTLFQDLLYRIYIAAA